LEPEDWKVNRSAGLINAPGDRRGVSFKMFKAPRSSQLGPTKFERSNYSSTSVRPQDLSQTARTRLGNGVRESIHPPDYVALPDEAMTRFRQERGFIKHLNSIRVPRPMVVCQGEVRQTVAANVQTEE